MSTPGLLSDTRDPKEVLKAEGVSFGTGVADPDAKLVADDLLALVEPEA